MYIAGLHPGAPKGNPEVSVGIVYSCNVGTPSWLTLGSHTEDTLSLSLELDGRLGFSHRVVLDRCQCETFGLGSLSWETEVGMLSLGHSLVLLLIHRGKVR